MNWEIKNNQGSGVHCEPLSELSEGRGGKALEKFTIFTLKLVWHSLLEIIELKLSHKKLLLSFKICIAMFVVSSQVKNEPKINAII